MAVKKKATGKSTSSKSTAAKSSDSPSATSKSAKKKTATTAKKSPPKKRAPAKKKKEKPSVVLKLYWGVFNQSAKRVAVFDFDEKKNAQKKAKELTKSTDTPHYVQRVKEAAE